MKFDLFYKSYDISCAFVLTKSFHYLCHKEKGSYHNNNPIDRTYTKLRRFFSSFRLNVYTMLEIRNLCAEVEGKQILRGVNLTINQGEVHVLMGPMARENLHSRTYWWVTLSLK